VRHTCAHLRAWDAATSGRPDVLITNSANVAARIARHYRREAEVIHAPIELARFAAGTGPRSYDLVVGAFAPNKRVDLALEAARRLGRPLVVAGSGPDAERLRRQAGADTRFLGWVDDRELADLYAGARALLFPGEEDFGLVPIEALASGCPVVAYGRGGALETVGRGAAPDTLARVAAGGVEVVPGGVLFGTQSVEALVEALQLLDRTPFDPHALRALAGPFDGAEFDRRFREAFDRGYAAWRTRRPAVPAPHPVADPMRA
jgi:glycosyltransferase involved in cell wall biosynthesis